MTILEMIRAQLAAKLAERATREADADALVATVETEGRSSLNETEGTRLAEIRAAVKAIDATLAELRQRETEEVAAVEARKAAESQAAALPTTTVVSERGAAPPPVIKVKAEARTYSPHNDRRGTMFLRDVMRAHTANDFQAMQRLDRHMQEERVERGAYMAGIEQRDVGTSAFAGLTVPQYLTDLVAPKIRNKRPFADICRHLDLPMAGMTVNISRITTGTGVAAQSAEAAAVQETDIDDTLLTVNVRTVAGQQDVSRQTVDRSSGGDQVVIEDLIGAYHEELDRQILVADGTGGTTWEDEACTIPAGISSRVAAIRSSV